MTTTADRTIPALRGGHDAMAGLVSERTPAQLSGSSGASEWSIAQVFSHLGSGAEIGLAVLEAALNGQPGPDGAVDSRSGTGGTRWTPWSRPRPSCKANEALVSRYEGLEELGSEPTSGSIWGSCPEPVEVCDRRRFPAERVHPAQLGCRGGPRPGSGTWHRTRSSCCWTSRRTCSAGWVGRRDPRRQERCGGSRDRRIQQELSAW